MNIVVCIKQVPEEIKIDKSRGILVRGGIRGVINACDKHAIELAISLKEQRGGEVTLVTMGPPQAENSLAEGLAMGADRAVLLCDRDFSGGDTLATSYTMAVAIKKVGEFHLILCGKETSDSGTGHVGPQLAQHLGLPQVTGVIKVEEATKDRIRARRMLEDEIEVIEVRTPVLFTVPKGINEPRSPTFSDIMEAADKEFLRWCAEDLQIEKNRIGLLGSPTKITSVFSPEARRTCEMLSGSMEDVTTKLVNRLSDRGVI